MMSENQENEPRRVFLSCLGTTNYVKVPYSALNQAEKEVVETSDATAFIQVARLKALQARNERPESVIILTTDAARTRNVQRVETAYDPMPKDVYLGLDVELDALNHESKKSLMPIPEGATVGELWQIFNTVLEQTKEGDELYLDITHGFRSLSAILIVALSFALKARKATLKEVSYGAWEAIKPASNRDPRPTFDLTPFFVLNDWTDAVNVFRVSRDLRPLAEVISKQSRHLRSRHRQNTPESFSKATDALNTLAETLVLCAIPNIANHAQSARESLENMSLQLTSPDYFELAPAQYLISEIINEIRHLEGGTHKEWKDIDSALAATAWSFQGRAYQPAITFLRETLTSITAKIASKKEILLDATRKEYDVLFSSLCFWATRKHAPTFQSERVEKAFDSMRSSYNEEHLCSFGKLGQDVINARNNLNHAAIEHVPAKTETMQKICRDVHMELPQILAQLTARDFTPFMLNFATQRELKEWKSQKDESKRSRQLQQ